MSRGQGRDYFLVSIGLTYLIRNVDILPGLSSDHSIVTLTVDIQDTNIRGKGYWKFNNDLLLDNEYVNKIKNTINSIKQNITMPLGICQMSNTNGHFTIR